MKRRNTNLILMSLTAAVILSTCSCHTTQKSMDQAGPGPNESVERLAFEDALQEDSTTAYAKFLHDYPDSNLADEARSRLAAVEARDWELASRTDTPDAYIRFHMSHRTARPQEVRDRLLNLASDSIPVVGGVLTEHNSYLQRANAVEYHNLLVRYGESHESSAGQVRPGALVGLLGAPGSRVQCTGGVCLPFPGAGTITTTGPLASMVFDDDRQPAIATRAEVTYVLIPASGDTMVFNIDPTGLHHVSGAGTVLVAAKGTVVRTYK